MPSGISGLVANKGQVLGGTQRDFPVSEEGIKRTPDSLRGLILAQWLVSMGSSLVARGQLPAPSCRNSQRIASESNPHTANHFCWPSTVMRYWVARLLKGAKEAKGRKAAPQEVLKARRIHQKGLRIT